MLSWLRRRLAAGLVQETASSLPVSQTPSGATDPASGETSQPVRGSAPSAPVSPHPMQDGSDVEGVESEISVTVPGVLLTGLSDSDAEVRRASVASIAALDLGHLDDASRLRVVTALRLLLGDAVPEIQLEAATTLAVALDDSRARSLLLEVAHAGTAAAEGVLSGATAAVSKSLRLSAVRTLGRLSDAATRAVLLAILRDADGEVRAAACTALGASKDPRAVNVLRRIEESDPDAAVRNEARAARESIAQRASNR